jgi:indole-3-glycerol phosphate synthase
MQDVDVGTIVPSTRDLLQAITTRRRNLALIGLIGGPAEEVAREAARLAELNVSAFAGLEPGPALAQVAQATKTVPSLVLVAAADRQALLAARQYGADGVAIDAALPLDAWDRLAKIARTMRMLPLALATDQAGLEAAVKAGARAILLRTASADALLELAARAPRGVTLVGHVEAADADALRALAGKVDAAVVPPALHAAASFAELVAEVDP